VYEISSYVAKFFFSAILFSVCFFSAAGQTEEQSLVNLVESSEGKNKIDPLIELSRFYANSNKFDEALPHIVQAQEMSRSFGDSARFVRSGRIRGQILNRLERMTEASEVLTEILPVAKRNNYRADYKTVLNNLALAYAFQAKYDDALKLHFETLQMREADNEVTEISTSLNNIGLVYFKLKNYKEALVYYLRAVETQKKGGFSDDIEMYYTNIGLCYNQLKDFEIALKYFDDAFKICSKECAPRLRVDANFGRGVAHYNLKNYDLAREYFNESLIASKAIPNRRFIAENLIYLAHISVQEKKLDESVPLLTECESIAREGGYTELMIETYREFANVFNLKREYESAAKYQDRYIHLKDSIYSERLITNIAKVQTQYAERENIKTIADNQAVIRQQRYLNVAIAIIAILAGLLILVLQRSNRVSKQVNAQLSEAKETIQQQNKLLEIKNKDLDREVEKKTADLERVNISLKQVNDELDNFIYKTSHDIRGPLASLKGMCNVALMDVTDEVALDYLRKLDATAERLNSILTRLLIINQINNSKLSLNRIDFNRIINDIILLEKKKGLPPKIEIRKKIADDPNIFIQSDRELVRIVLENLIDNAIKFYNDSERVNSFVEINISHTNEGVKARVIDNGIGISESNPGKLFQMFFRASERSEIGGIGLYIVKTATSKIGGKVGLLTTPEGYTEFYVLFPPQPPSHDTFQPLQNAVVPLTASPNPFL
jgi:signal transduction histidine kinase/Tfp pilus assembly protein PilF